MYAGAGSGASGGSCPTGRHHSTVRVMSTKKTHTRKMKDDRFITCPYPDCKYKWKTKLPAPKVPKECPFCKRYLHRAEKFKKAR